MAAKLRVVGRAGQPAKLLEIVFPRSTQVLREQCGQPGVRLLEPAPHCDSVGDIDEAVGIHLREIAEHELAHDVGVQLRDAVDLVAADDGEVRHAHAPAVRVVDDG